jgi:hypothetical protein
LPVLRLRGVVAGRQLLVAAVSVVKDRHRAG